MTQKQIIGVVLGVALVVVVCAFVYRQLVAEDASTGKPASSTTSSPETASSQSTAPVPETPDEIARSITVQAGIDTSALDEEEASELREIDADSENVTNLGTSYDENNF